MKTSTYSPQTLLDLWKKVELTIEMAVGHILQRLVNHEERLQALERQGNQPEADSAT